MSITTLRTNIAKTIDHLALVNDDRAKKAINQLDQALENLVPAKLLLQDSNGHDAAVRHESSLTITQPSASSLNGHQNGNSCPNEQSASVASPVATVAQPSTASSLNGHQAGDPSSNESVAAPVVAVAQTSTDLSLNGHQNGSNESVASPVAAVAQPSTDPSLNGHHNGSNGSVPAQLPQKDKPSLSVTQPPTSSSLNGNHNGDPYLTTRDAAKYLKLNSGFSLQFLAESQGLRCKRDKEGHLITPLSELDRIQDSHAVWEDIKTDRDITSMGGGDGLTQEQIEFLELGRIRRSPWERGKPRKQEVK